MYVESSESKRLQVKGTKTMTKYVGEFQVDIHGIDYPDYFTGGTSLVLSDFEDRAIGVGDTQEEAINDALEQLSMDGWDCEAIKPSDHTTSEASAYEETRIDISNNVTPKDYGCDEFDEDKHEAHVDSLMEPNDTAWYVTVLVAECRETIGWDDETPLKDLGHEVPAWIDQDITGSTVCAIRQGGCASGAYVPAVTYSTANDIMAKHGDEVLQYIEDCYDGLPDVPRGSSWCGLAVFYLSYAIECWASQFEQRD